LENTAKLLSSGDKGSNSTLKDTTLEKDAVLAFKAFDTDVSAKPDYLPLVAAAGVLLFEPDHVAQLYLQNHCLYQWGG